MAQSIDSDLSYLRYLLTLSPLLPKGLYLDNTLRVAKKELGWECDYIREAACTTKFRELIQSQHGLNVPQVFPDLSTSNVLTTEWVNGIPLGDVAYLPQYVKDEVGERMFRLCLDELFKFRFMQTDPNWTNFLYDVDNDIVNISFTVI